MADAYTLFKGIALVSCVSKTHMSRALLLAGSFAAVQLLYVRAGGNTCSRCTTGGERTSRSQLHNRSQHNMRIQRDAVDCDLVRLRGRSQQICRDDGSLERNDPFCTVVSECDYVGQWEETRRQVSGPAKGQVTSTSEASHVPNYCWLRAKWPSDNLRFT